VYEQQAKNKQKIFLKKEGVFARQNAQIHSQMP
jgi:hypothetical protein